jgi:hypothetical protein
VAASSPKKIGVNRLVRLTAGVVVLLILVVVGLVLVPPYAANWRLQSYINDLADDPAAAKKPPDVVRANVLNQAASLGLPVHSQDVHVTINDDVRIDVLYIVHVDFAGYTIDLHFRPTAGN